MTHRSATDHGTRPEPITVASVHRAVRVFPHLGDPTIVVLADSGGAQEEATSLGKPVLMMRENTEHSKTVDAWAARLNDTDEQGIVREVTQHFYDRDAFDTVANTVSPYGDGHAAARGAATIQALLGADEHPRSTAEGS